MSKNEMVAPPMSQAGIGVFCDVQLIQPNHHGPEGSSAKGYYVWVGVRGLNEELALESAKSFLDSADVLSVEIDDAVVLDEEDFKEPDKVQQLGGRVYYAS
ncbi:MULTISPECIES: hypothetical protein [unclassified Roseovarius]|uniref:hypothetical protein n=1 Tax=unclassified Roseovarius TaxID=2614913 RepID=UPI00273DC9F4|nr:MULTISPECIES: hypothetical protein [unclassified Roseovarius]